MKIPKKYTVTIVIAFIIFLILVIISGRILYDINKSSCKNTDAHLQDAHSWTAWTVGLASFGAGLTLIGIILIILANAGVIAVDTEKLGITKTLKTT